MSKHRILVVEDEAIVAADLQERLSQQGFEVVGWATSGEEALELVRKTAPDLVLMDIILNGALDGLEAAEACRAYYALPVIYLSANANEGLLERAKRTEPFGYLLKPFDERELKVCIELAIYKSRLERERETLRRQLQHALDEVKTLRGLLPICSWCHRIRDDHGYWENVELYLTKIAGTRFSHGICPSCQESIEDRPG
jgi:two-component system, response regulator PdtaR